MQLVRSELPCLLGLSRIPAVVRSVLHENEKHLSSCLQRSLFPQHKRAVAGAGCSLFQFANADIHGPEQRDVRIFCYMS